MPYKIMSPNGEASMFNDSMVQYEVRHIVTVVKSECDVILLVSMVVSML